MINGGGAGLKARPTSNPLPSNITADIVGSISLGFIKRLAQ
jgi:hypothetical protein